MVKNLKMLNLKSGRLIKTTAAIALTAALSMSTVFAAEAAIPSSDIVSEIELGVNRDYQKLMDGQALTELFSEHVFLQDIEQAVEITDTLEAYSPASYGIHNTSLSEIRALNVDSIYWDYCNYDENYFAEQYIYSYPALEAYCTLGTNVVSNEITTGIAERINNLFYLNDSDYRVEKVIKNAEEGVYDVLMKDSQGIYIYVTLQGEDITEIFNAQSYLDTRFARAIANASGVSEEYDNNFTYCGVDSYDDASAYISFEDEELKGMLKTGIQMSKSIKSSDDYDFVYGFDENGNETVTVSKTEDYSLALK